MHINWLELLAAMLTVKCYAKDQHDILVQLKVDSETALTYINQLGGTLSPPRAGSADERTVALVPRQEHNPASHSPAGVLNGTADEESRVLEARQDRLEALSTDLQEDRPTNWATTGGPVCVTPDLPASGLCELKSM